jgi:thiol:disulfide interchange protein DsbD
LTLKILCAALLLLGPWHGYGAHTQVSLLLGAESAKPGDTVMAGVQLRMDSGWHTYWRSPGAAGSPTAIEWHLPTGIQAGQIKWPLPEKLTEQDLTTYIYKNEVVLLVPLTLSKELKPGPLELKASVSWLECAVQCVPGHADVQAPLVIGSETKPSQSASLLQTWQSQVPRTNNALATAARWDAPAKEDARPLRIQWHPDGAVSEVDFFPDNSESFEIQGATETVPAETGLVAIRKQVKKFSGDWPKQVSGVLIQGSGNQRVGYEANVTIGAATTAPAAALPGEAVGAPSLWKMLLYAVVGGLILNIMPCVLPVIALKILGFIGQSRDNPAQGRRLGLIYAAGVLVSFLLLAGLVIGIKAKAGWGFQFGNPYFLVVMTTLVTLIALNLFGIFEVTLGGRALDTATGLASKHGAAGAFFNGLLATVLATSCTAPFLGAAVGFAFGQPPAVVLLMFCAIGVGLAAPYLILTWQPGWLKFLPKPGAWMERFKIAMGFPMLAAAVWLFSLVSLHYGERSWWLAMFLVMVSIAAWIYGEFVQRNRTRPGLALTGMIAVLAAGYTLVLEGKLRWREPELAGAAVKTAQNAPSGIEWGKWSPEAVAQARAQNRPVLVDFTAKWCLTCNTLVKPVLESASVRKKLQESNAVALLGDYTLFPDDITQELKRHGRAGVPLVLVYSGNPNDAPIVLPEALTPGIVVNALEHAAGALVSKNAAMSAEKP